MRRAARQIGHHWHSGDSPTSGGISLVTVSQMSARSARPPPNVRRTWPVISLRIDLALERRSQRWKSLSISAPGAGCRGLDGLRSWLGRTLLRGTWPGPETAPPPAPLPEPPVPPPKPRALLLPPVPAPAPPDGSAAP